MFSLIYYKKMSAHQWGSNREHCTNIKGKESQGTLETSLDITARCKVDYRVGVPRLKKYYLLLISTIESYTQFEWTGSFFFQI